MCIVFVVVNRSAVENTVHIVHADASGERETPAGSHGHSRVISHSGHVTAEAGIWDEEVVCSELDLDRATGVLTLRSAERSFLRDRWEQGVRRVRRIDA